MQQHIANAEIESQQFPLALPCDDSLFADSARHAYLEGLRDTPESCLWDFMNWRGAPTSDERI
jgi:hypothetical protein